MRGPIRTSAPPQTLPSVALPSARIALFPMHPPEVAVIQPCRHVALTSCISALPSKARRPTPCRLWRPRERAMRCRLSPLLRVSAWGGTPHHHLETATPCRLSPCRLWCVGLGGHPPPPPRRASLHCCGHGARRPIAVTHACGFGRRATRFWVGHATSLQCVCVCGGFLGGATALPWASLPPSLLPSFPLTVNVPETST